MGGVCLGVKVESRKMGRERTKETYELRTLLEAMRTSSSSSLRTLSWL
jgi:hypothetical protein